MAGNNVRGNGAATDRQVRSRGAVALGDPPEGEDRPVTPAPKWLGKRVGRFKLVGVLGEGAMGKVFRAEDTLLGRYAALKVLPKTYRRGGKSIAVERLIREARAAASLHHPNAVTIYEVNEAKGIYYIAMEVVEGGSLHQLVRSAGPLDYPRACLLAADAGDALAQAHLLGIVHRDVKPANLMLTRAGRCKVVDFGLAHLAMACDESLLFSGSVGTPHFIAPEIARGGAATARSDIYSLGATMWYLLTGKPPFEGGTTQELLKKHIEGKLPDLAAMRPDLPAGLVQAMLAAMEKSPEQRLASVEEFARAVRVYTIGTDGGMGSSAVVGWSSGTAMAGGSRAGSGSMGAAGVGSASVGARSMGARSSGTSKSAGVGPVAAAEVHNGAGVARRKRWAVIGGCAAAAVAGVVAIVLVAGNRGKRAGANGPVAAAAVKPAADEAAKDAAASVEAPAEAAAPAEGKSAAADVQPAPAAKSASSGSALAITNRGQSLARKGQFEAALAEFDQAIATDPGDAMAWFETAQIKLYLGDVEGYRRACRQMVEQLGKGVNKTAAQRAARASLLAPDSGIDLATANRLTDQALAGNWAQGKVLGGFQLTKAMAEYRSGQFAAAVDLLNQAGELLTSSAERATVDLLLAMSYQGLGKTAERDAAAKSAAKLIDGPVGRAGVDDLPTGVENWLTCQIVKNEAAKLLGTIGAKGAEKASAVLPAGKKGKGSSPAAPMVAKALDLLKYGKFEEAIAQCDKAIEVNEREHTAWYMRTMLKLYQGDVPGYREGCGAMLEKFGKVGPDQGGRAVAGQRAARVCLMTPEMSTDTDLLTKLADQAIASEAEPRLLAFFKITRGMADYRAGRYEAAVSILQDANADLPGAAERATTQLVTAMAYQKMGKGEDAAGAMAQAMDLIDAKLAKPGSDDLGPGAENWVICQIVKREAARVVGR